MTAYDDVEAFLRVFESTATHEGWAVEEWALALAPLLTGEAQCANFSLRRPPRRITLRRWGTPPPSSSLWRRSNWRMPSNTGKLGTERRRFPGGWSRSDARRRAPPRTVGRPAVPSPQDKPIPTAEHTTPPRTWLAGCTIHQSPPPAAPEADIKLNGKPMRAILDSGSAVTLEQSRLCPPHPGQKSLLSVTCSRRHPTISAAHGATARRGWIGKRPSCGRSPGSDEYHPADPGPFSLGGNVTSVSGLISVALATNDPHLHVLITAERSLLLPNQQHGFISRSRSEPGRQTSQAGCTAD
ncbi:hypothetical protein M9458_052014 [Cirrhinus mrigala]|uniref:Peptidase A2 domain-containing protein n=1 Tax=Cirrhinus mrigala TaxID=683832 RepID=A0ABD0MTJ9_CIRMR